MGSSSQRVPPNRAAGSRLLAVVAGCGVVAVGVLVLAGWWLHAPILTALGPEYGRMKANPALALICAGVALTALAAGGSRARLVTVLAGFILVLGAGTLFEYTLDVDLGIDQLLARDDHAGYWAPGRMAPATALSLLLYGTAFLATARRSRGVVAAAQGFCLLGMVAPFLAMVGHLYGVGFLYGITSLTHMALPTSLTLLALGVGFFAAQPDVGLGAVVAGDTAGGLLARRMLPASVLLPLLSGWLRLKGQRAGLYRTELGLAINATTNVLVFASLVMLSARQVNRQQRKRLLAEEALRELNAGLEKTVAARTADLTRANDELNHQIAERTRAQDAFRGLADAAFEGIAIVDGAEIVEVNAALASTFGRTRDDLVGTNAGLLVDPADRQTAMDYLVSAAQDSLLSNGLRCDGSRFPIEVKSRAIDLGGRPLRALAVHDLTERRRSEEALRRSESQFRTLVEGLPDMVLVIRNGRFVYVNRAAVATFGFASAGEMIGQLLLDRIRPDQTARAGRLLEEPPTPSANYAETTCLRKDGSAILVESVTIGADYEGEPARVTIARDVTARREAEEEARRATVRWRAILDGSPHSIIATSPDGIITEFNPAAERMLGYDAAAVIGKATPAMIHDPVELVARADLLTRELKVTVAPGFETFVARSRLGLRDESEWTYIRRDGSRFPVRLAVSAMRDAGGAITGFLGMGSDITESKQANEEMVRAREAAVQALRARADFLARMSHEIRTPMNGVIGMTELALQTRLTAEQEDYLQTALASARSLLSLINDILDFSKMDAGKLRLEAIPFRPREVVGAGLRALARQGHDKKLELIFEVAPDVPQGLIGDPFRLQQVITNLVGNAVKFTDRGEVVVRATVAERHPDRILLAVEVIDSGIGISPEKHAMMFEAFSQANEAITRNFGGTGLGLAICAQLVDLMGGRIAVESALGQGSRFHFTIPLPIDALVSEKEPTLGLAGMRVLVVEDHPRQRAVLRAMLESWRFEVTEATGTDVRKMARAAREGGSPFGMVLLDGNLPGQDSVELAIELRAEQPALALVLLPASGQTIDPRRERQLGTYGHVAKPVLASTLLETVQALLSGGVITRPDRTTAITAITASVGRSRRILVAEDNAVNRKLIIHILDKMGHQAVAVGDGRKALAALAGGGFDLVLMDVQMPEMDGFEATRVLRASEAGGGRRVPVIALTAQAMKGDRELCLAAGMDGYVAKPIDRQELFFAIERALADGIEAPPPVTRPDGVEVPPPITVEAPAPVSPLARPDAFDRAELLDRTDGDPGLFSALISLFLGGLPDAVAVLQRAIEAHDASALERGAHALRGSLLNLAAHPASALAKQLEDDGRHDDFGPVQETFTLLRGELGRLRAELEYTPS